MLVDDVDFGVFGGYGGICGNSEKGRRGMVRWS